jgi:hypothetical protein
MNHEYFKLALNFIANLVQLLDANSEQNGFDRPSDISFFEEWVADGFVVKWDVNPAAQAFWVVCIWRGREETGGPVEAIRVEHREKLFNSELNSYTYLLKKQVQIDNKEDLIKAFHEWQDMVEEEAARRDDEYSASIREFYNTYEE